jgi:hypothetical protein
MKSETEIIASFKFANIIKTYNGKTGCACGCGGDYTQAGDTSDKVLKRINFIRKNLHRAEVDYYTDEVIYSVENDTGTRVTRIYVKEEA